ncbi:CoA-binding protein [Halovivax gelatinilyticus]|uniref:CoA-binding protein n=1 Tax=Halovivax gelatinilyticus TaxID=2961597 RepID=UPI0020CA367D|nr:CoA-binding protein [Halovivax gelatinilyticus]
MPVESDEAVQEILGLRRVGVVGCSRTPGKAAHEVPAYLDANGYEVVPVNPNADELFGREAVDTLADVGEPIDVVTVFRPSEEVASIVDAAIERDDVSVVWTQLGIRDEAAFERAEAAGLTVVADRCMKVEHRRLYG